MGLAHGAYKNLLSWPRGVDGRLSVSCQIASRYSASHGVSILLSARPAPHVPPQPVARLCRLGPGSAVPALGRASSALDATDDNQCASMHSDFVSGSDVVS